VLLLLLLRLLRLLLLPLLLCSHSSGSGRLRVLRCRRGWFLRQPF
jgi:hypothetical protein